MDSQIDFLRSLLKSQNKRFAASPDLSYELLEKIATLRFICTHISHWIIECYDLLRTQSNTQLPDHIVRERQRLINEFRDICLMQGYEDLHVFLLKNIYHLLGSDTLSIIPTNCHCSWVIPEQVMEKLVQVRSQHLFLLCSYFLKFDLVTSCGTRLLYHLRRRLCENHTCRGTCQFST